MKRTISKHQFLLLVSVCMATIALPALRAESRCPGNVASVPFHLVNRYQMIVAVSVNHSGPYEFLLDTGTQISMVDNTLAEELHLETRGAALVAGAGFQSPATYARIAEVEAGSHEIRNQDVVVYDLRRLLAAHLEVRGILGEDFLQHFDMLIDNANRLLCLDDTVDMRLHIKGPHIPLLTSPEIARSVSLPNSLIISVRLSDGMRPVRLKLDSGTNSAFLYDASQFLAVGLFKGASLHGSGADGTVRAYSTLPPQNVKIGSLELTGVTFLTLTGTQKNSATSDFDGLLTVGLFRRIFICHTDHFAIIEAQ
jgi:hypothetical protein